MTYPQQPAVQKRWVSLYWQQLQKRTASVTIIFIHYSVAKDIKQEPQGRFVYEAAFCGLNPRVHAPDSCRKRWHGRTFYLSTNHHPFVRRQHEIEYVPIGHEAAQDLPNKRGFLWRFRRIQLRSLKRSRICSRCRKSRGEEVADQIIEF